MVNMMNIDLNNSQLIPGITMEEVCAGAFGSAKTGGSLNRKIILCFFYRNYTFWWFGFSDITS